jgi:CRP-like cAMP-binding protein
VRSNLTIKGESLAGIPLLADLDLTVRDKIADRCTGYEFAAGTAILRYGDAGTDVFLIMSGIVEVALMSVGGKRVTYCEKQPGDLVGVMAAIDGQARCASVTAKTNCRLIEIPAAEFSVLLSTSAAFTQKVLLRMTQQVRELTERVFDFSALLVQHRIHVELLRLAHQASGLGNTRKISPAPTHAQIASRASTHREAVAREFSLLLKAGLLVKSGPALVVTDVAWLESSVARARGTLPAAR